MQNYRSSGAIIDVILPETALAGVPYVHGQLVGIPVSDGDGENIRALHLTGVYRLPKGAAALGPGVKAYWNSTDNTIVGTATGNQLIGYTVAAATAEETTVDVVLANGV